MKGAVPFTSQVPHSILITQAALASSISPPSPTCATWQQAPAAGSFQAPAHVRQQPAPRQVAAPQPLAAPPPLDNWQPVLPYTHAQLSQQFNHYIVEDFYPVTFSVTDMPVPGMSPDQVPEGDLYFEADEDEEDVWSDAQEQHPTAPVDMLPALVHDLRAQAAAEGMHHCALHGVNPTHSTSCCLGNICSPLVDTLPDHLNTPGSHPVDLGNFINTLLRHRWCAAISTQVHLHSLKHPQPGIEEEIDAARAKELKLHSVIIMQQRGQLYFDSGAPVPLPDAFYNIGEWERRAKEREKNIRSLVNAWVEDRGRHTLSPWDRWGQLGRIPLWVCHLVPALDRPYRPADRDPCMTLVQFEAWIPALRTVHGLAAPPTSRGVMGYWMGSYREVFLEEKQVEDEAAAAAVAERKRISQERILAEQAAKARREQEWDELLMGLPVDSNCSSAADKGRQREGSPDSGPRDTPPPPRRGRHTPIQWPASNKRSSSAPPPPDRQRRKY